MTWSFDKPDWLFNFMTIESRLPCNKPDVAQGCHSAQTLVPQFNLKNIF